MDYSVYDAIRAGFGKIVFVIRKHFRADFEAKVVSKYKNKIEVELIEQELDKLPEGFNLNKTLSESGEVSRGICTVNQDGYLTTVEEHHKIKDNNGTITGIGMNAQERTLNGNAAASMNMWGFTPDIFHYGQQLFINFLQENANEPKKEFYIPFIVNSSIQDGSATVKVLSTPENWFGVTYQEDRPMVVNKLKGLTEKGTYPKINLLPGLISSPTLTA